MNFCSISFLFLFIPIFLLLYFILPKKYNNIVLLLGSIVFYLSLEPIYIFLILGLTFIDYYTLNILKNNSKKINYIFLILINILPLMIFKVLNISVVGYVLFLLRMIGYIIDIYNKKYNHEKNIINYMLYIFMFSIFIYGPIINYEDISKQLNNREINIDSFTNGFLRFIRGLFKNVIIVSNLYLLFNTVTSINKDELSVALSILGLISLTLGICIEFSGYNDMALGLGEILGFKYKENYDKKLFSTSFKDFLSRINITLANYFNKYIPSKGIIKLVLITLILSILLKSNSLIIVLFIYMSLILIFEKYILKDRLTKLPKYLKYIYTILISSIFLLIVISINNYTLTNYLKSLFLMNNIDLINSSFIYYFSNYFIIILIGILMFLPIKFKYNKITKVLRIIIYVVLFLIVISYLITNSYNSFIGLVF